MIVTVSMHVTGPDPWTHEVVQVGAIVYEPGFAEVSRFSSYVKLERPEAADPNYLLLAGIGSEHPHHPKAPYKAVKEREVYWNTAEEVWSGFGRFLARHAGGFTRSLDDAVKNTTFCFFDAAGEAPYFVKGWMDSGVSPGGLSGVKTRSLLSSFRDHEAILSYIGMPWTIPQTLAEAVASLGAKDFSPIDASSRANSLGDCFRKHEARIRNIYETAAAGSTRKGKRTKGKAGAPVIRPKKTKL